MANALAFFESFNEEEIQEVVEAAVWQEFDKDDEIIQEGDVDDSFFIIVSGRVAVRKGGTDLDILSAGSCFGEMGFVGGTKRTATIVAKSAVSVMKVTGSSIEKASVTCQLHFKNVFLETLVRASVTRR